MNAQESLREACARQAILKRFETEDPTYNTGATLIASDASEYIGYVVAMLPRGLHQRTGPVPDPVLLATGATGGLLIIETKLNRAEPCALAAVASPAKMVGTVRSTFRLKISEASRVLRISRPTAYQWESLNDIEAIRAHNDRDRLKQLYRIASDWSARNPPCGRWLHVVLANGKSIFDLLSEENINEVALKQAYDLLLAIGPRLQADEHQRSVSAVEAMKGAFEKLAANEKKRARKDSL